MNDRDLLNLVRRTKYSCERVHAGCTCMMQVARQANGWGRHEEKTAAINFVLSKRLDDSAHIAGLHEALHSLRCVAAQNAWVGEFVVRAQRAFRSPWPWRRRYGHEFLRLAREFALEGR